MNKPLFGVVLGGILGAFDGLSSLVSAPEVQSQITGIVVGSTFKGVIAGVSAGFFARRVNSVPLGVAFGLVVGALLAFGVVTMQKAAGQPGYFWEIMLPGALVGALVGFATQRHQEARR